VLDRSERSRYKLKSGSSVAVIGGGPAGAFFSYSLLKMAKGAGLNITLDLYESRDFSLTSSMGCNMCGGVISETLVKELSKEGIILPSTVVKNTIDSYVLHMGEYRIFVKIPVLEKRIATVHRGAGPKGIKDLSWRSFDGYLLELATLSGTNLIKDRVTDISLDEGRPKLKSRTGATTVYDFLVVAAGVNSSTLKLFEKMDIGYKPPVTERAFIRDFYLGSEKVKKYLANSIQVFLPDIPGIKLAALIPKFSYVTLCLIGDKITPDTISDFLKRSRFAHSLPDDFYMPEDSCRCTPFMNVEGAKQPFFDRMLFIGDCGVTRLYKDGIGSAYRSARAAAKAALFSGISYEDFRRSYLPVCRSLERDNDIGRLIFSISYLIRKIPFTREAVFYITSREQKTNRAKRMSIIFWDLFTGSASYSSIFLRCLNPLFLFNFLWNITLEFIKDRFMKKD